MTGQSRWRPERALLLALLLVGLDVLLAVLLLLRVLPMGRWYGLAILVAGLVAAGLILSFSRKLRRKQRPEWLETQAWAKGLKEKLEHHPEDAQKATNQDSTR